MTYRYQSRLLTYAALFGVLVCPVVFGETFKVRVLNATDSKGIAKQQISISYIYEKGQGQASGGVVASQTNAQGEAEFTIPNPLPSRVSIHVKADDRHWRCACLALVATNDLLQTGFLGPAGAQNKAKARPREAIFTLIPLSFWERLLYPLVKG
jgi:hypothetical protein